MVNPVSFNSSYGVNFIPNANGATAGTYKKEVILNGTSYTISLYVKEGGGGASIPEDVKKKIEAIKTLALEVGLGSEEGFESLKINNEGAVEGVKAKTTSNPQPKAENIIGSLQSPRSKGLVNCVAQIFFPSQIDSPKIDSLESSSSTDAVAIEPKTKFFRGIAEFTLLHKELNEIDLEKTKKTLETYAAQLPNINPNMSKAHIDALKGELLQASQDCRTQFNEANKTTFDVLEKKLLAVTNLYNDQVQKTKGMNSTAPDYKEAKHLEGLMYSELMKCNKEMGNRSLTTHRLNGVKAHIMNFQSVIEKKLFLLEKKLDLEQKQRDLTEAGKQLPPTSWMDKILGREDIRTHKKEKSQVEDELRQVNKDLREIPKEKREALLEKKGELERKIEQSSFSLVRYYYKKKLKGIDKDLSKAPTNEMLEEAKGKLLNALTEVNTSELKSIKECKAYNREFHELSWGSSHLNQALKPPANWTDIRTTCIQMSEGGTAYVVSSINEPLNVKETGGVPTGLRSHEKERATNLIKTTAYVLDSKGSPHNPVVSFRGGQFPTVEAAKEALVQIKEALGEKPLTALHINALLTPTAMTALKEDKALLVAHNNNILEALKNPGFEDLKRNVAISNFGVNEGAVKQLEIKGITVPVASGWHTSIGDYSNKASQKLNASLQQFFKKSFDEMTPQERDRIPAILQVGQEMEAIWAKNDYADATVGNNQFKLPALWKTMDALLDVVCYTNCMSGKDRTGKVESSAQDYLNAISMNTLDQKAKLNTFFDPDPEIYSIKSELSEPNKGVWEGAKEKLTSASFTEKDLESLKDKLTISADEFNETLKRLIETKIKGVENSLKLEGDKPFMQAKTTGSTFLPRALQINVNDISTNTPLRESQQIDLKTFPSLVVTSVYEKSPDGLTNKEAFLEKKQREAINSRLSQVSSGSLQVTQMNTGRPGFKVEGGEPLARFSSGFDREYVLFKLDKKTDLIFENLTGLDELDNETKNKFLNEFRHILNSGPLKKGGASYIPLLKEIEEAKMKTMFPTGKVKS